MILTILTVTYEDTIPGGGGSVRPDVDAGSDSILECQNNDEIK